MNFDYDVLTEEQATKERFKLLEDGDYPATVRRVTHRMSPKGNNMYEVDLDVYDKEGHIHSLRDYWVFARNMLWKVIRAADSCGLVKEYEQKKFTPDIIEGKNCIVSVRTREGNEIPHEKLKGKPVGSRYPTKNVVEDYVKKSEQSSNAAASTVDEFSDDVPF